MLVHCWLCIDEVLTMSRGANSPKKANGMFSIIVEKKGRDTRKKKRLEA
jgi:hypothetical protein